MRGDPGEGSHGTEPASEPGPLRRDQQTRELRPTVQVLEVEGPTVAMEAAYLQLARDQQAVTLLARLDGWQAGMAPVSVNVTMSQRVAGGVVPLNSADLTLWTRQLYWDGARNATQAVSLSLPPVSPLTTLAAQRDALLGGRCSS